MWILALLACNRVLPTDKDEDGWLSNVDCDDLNPAINPAMDEIPGDGVNNDCNLQTPDDDYDGDGLVGIDDCDPLDPLIPRPEVPYDGVDNDCDDTTPDDDLDGDGADGDIDCDDDDPDVRPGLPEVPYDGVDNDCDPLTSDADADGDGLSPPEDCDDTNPFVQGPAEWFVDCDQDGYARIDAPSIFACRPVNPSCGGTGWWTTIAPTGTPSSPGNDRIDCADLEPNAHPGQVNWFSTPISIAPLDFDYDCDGQEEREYLLYSCARIGQTNFCNVTPGFFDNTLQCGDQGAFADDCLVIDGACEEPSAPVAAVRCR